MPVSFSVDLNELKKRHRTLMQEFHPDRYVAADAISRRKSVQMATLLNQAATTLTTPLLRASYLLELVGESADNHRSVDGNSLNNQTATDSEFLMQQMEWREAIENLSPDKDDSLFRLDSLYSEIQAVEKSLYQQFANAYNEKDYSLSRGILQKLQFISKINMELVEVEDQFEQEGC